MFCVFYYPLFFFHLHQLQDLFCLSRTLNYPPKKGGGVIVFINQYHSALERAQDFFIIMFAVLFKIIVTDSLSHTRNGKSDVILLIVRLTPSAYIDCDDKIILSSIFNRTSAACRGIYAHSLATAMKRVKIIAGTARRHLTEILGSCNHRRFLSQPSYANISIAVFILVILEMRHSSCKF